ncbi:hypothetical protein OPV22_004852 [Ensete ventricosum]|uniref:Uncharacterized protein n=1 Tax=Ensete ventricosum TaxID=4639 RepID=A0AAV8Q124_ENSVE|nr:hypothetical protein OPV22_004852 [Ensete ventricosum]
MGKSMMSSGYGNHRWQMMKMKHWALLCMEEKDKTFSQPNTIGLRGPLKLHGGREEKLTNLKQKLLALNYCFQLTHSPLLLD